MIYPWLLKPALYEDELFSSWLIRAAFLHGCDPMTLTNDIWPEWRPWTVDRDRSITNERLAILANLVGVKPTFFSKTFLSPIAERITQKKLQSHNRWPFILTYGMRNRRSHAGIQYCPVCIHTNEPYIRRAWRLAWNVICPIHEVKLIDHCSHCFKPIQIQKLEAPLISLTTCPFCICNLVQPSKISKHFSAKAYEVQNACNTILKHPSSKIRALFFEKLEFSISLIRLSSRSCSEGLRSFIRDFDITPYRCQTGLAFEFLPNDERINLLKRSQPLMINSYSSIIYSLRKNNVSLRSIQSMKKSIPEEFEKLARSELNWARNTIQRSRSSEQRKPKPVLTVKRMHARLIRKFNSYS